MNTKRKVAPLIATIITFGSLSGGAIAQTVTTNDQSFIQLLDGFDADPLGRIITAQPGNTVTPGTVINGSSFTTVAGTVLNGSIRVDDPDVESTNNTNNSISTLGYSISQELFQVASFQSGDRALALNAAFDVASTHMLDVTFQSNQTSFGLYLGDFGDSNDDTQLSSITIRSKGIGSSNGVVLFQYDENVDPHIDILGPTANKLNFYGITGGDFTGFTVEHVSTDNDNIFIDSIVAVPEPSSSALLGLGALGLLLRRKR